MFAVCTEGGIGPLALLECSKCSSILGNIDSVLEPALCLVFVCILSMSSKSIVTFPAPLCPALFDGSEPIVWRAS